MGKWGSGHHRSRGKGVEVGVGVRVREIKAVKWEGAWVGEQDIIGREAWVGHGRVGVEEEDALNGWVFVHLTTPSLSWCGVEWSGL